MPFHNELPTGLTGSDRCSFGSAGSLLETKVCALMEYAFQCDFSDVRLHLGSEASKSTKALHAQAYVVGKHIVFGEGQYNPSSRKGFWLLAHELVHVLQQRRGFQLGNGQSDDDPFMLECEANRVADFIVAGGRLPKEVAVRAATFGAIQCHVDQPCPGTPLSSLRPPEIYVPANAAIEMAYKADPINIRHADGILVGSNFDRGEIQLPKGAPNKRFGDVLLTHLRGLVRQRRPDIIDFVSRVIYEIKPAGRERQGSVQLQSYYALTDLIRREHAAFSEPPWKVEYAVWYPPHVLPLEDGTLTGDRIVCTQATNHQRWPGLILYDVRKLDDEEKKKRRQRPTVRVEVSDFDPAFTEFWPALRKELRRGIPFYDPYDPEYVIIIPSQFYQAQYKQWNERLVDKFMRVKPGDFPGAHEIAGEKHVLLVMAGIAAGVGAGAVVIVGATVLLAPAAGVSAAAAATATTGAVVETTTATGIVVVEAGGSTAGAAVAVGGTAAGVDVAALAARAALAAPQARNIAAGLGVLMVLATVRDAKADSRSVSSVSAIRAVPLADFRRSGGFPAASGTPRNPKLDAIGVCNAGFGRDFALGGTVLFDGQPHNIIAQISAR